MNILEKIPSSCVFCDSNHIVGSGHTPSGMRVWRCKGCNRRFRAVRHYGKGRTLTIEHKEKLKTYLPIDKLRYDYLTLTMPMRVIARKWGCGYKLIRRNLRDNNIPIRTVAEQCRTNYTRQQRSQLAFGNQATLGYKHTEGAKKIMSVKRKELMAKLSERLKLSKVHLKLWADPIHKNKQERLMRLGLHIKPNKPETILLQILDKYWTNEWKYVGDGSLMIEGKNPDFININGHKLIIELFGEYWHEPHDEIVRTQIFAQYGYKTLVIWVKELNDIDKLVAKIGEYVGECK